MTCSTAEHRAIRADDARWEAETYAIGVQKDDEGRDLLLLANCCVCNSTLARCLCEEDEA